MNYTRQIRYQLKIFTAISVIAMVVVAIKYAQIPQSAGLGKFSVTVQLSNASGLYENSNVTYRGNVIGKVTTMIITEQGASVTASIDSAEKIPEDTDVKVASMSAIGEQYLDFEPRGTAGPYLHDGSTIAQNRTSIPKEFGPILDQVKETLLAVGPDSLYTVLNESFLAVNGLGPQMNELISSLSVLAQMSRDNQDPVKSLIDNIGPLLQTQVDSGGAIAQWAEALAGVTAELSIRDIQLRSVIAKASPTSKEVRGLFSDLQPLLPVLLSNLVTVEQVAAVYNPALEQIFVLYPSIIAATQSTSVFADKNDPGSSTYFATGFNDPAPCIEGFLPPSERRSPTELDVIPTPKDLYCKVSPDDPRAVRGSRNLPCIEFPGYRAATVQLCRIVAHAGNSSTTDHFTGQVRPTAVVTTYSPIDGSYLGSDGLFYTNSGLSRGKNGSSSSLASLLIPSA
ncbi:MAG: MCE family protein [Mycobacteriaceae bacterium]